MKPSAKRVALNKLALTRNVIEALEPADKPWIAWDDKFTGFGVRVHPSGTKSFIVNYRTGDGGRKAPNKRVVLGHHGKISPGRARRLARQVLDEAAADPAGGRPATPGMPMLEQAFEAYMVANPHRAASTNELDRYRFKRCLGDWQMRPLDAITRRDVEGRFNRITGDSGGSTANQTISLLRSIYRRSSVDFEGLAQSS